jgi:hypothetical protein
MVRENFFYHHPNHSPSRWQLRVKHGSLTAASAVLPGMPTRSCMRLGVWCRSRVRYMRRWSWTWRIRLPCGEHDSLLLRERQRNAS